ncbi:TetR/AcrR family transcriptional regulator [Poriferisphaera sp. WC338]|uniref:TetR/AcrR family transcriptional regulator n=1 Tax=Poriferisphaera sp. WC338 TaxID=3425129 RepID=UPI003D814696
MNQTAETTSARQQQAEKTRASILDAAEQLFADRGFAGTSMAEVARISKTSKPLIHHHFHSKRDLYLAIQQRVIARLPEYEIDPETLLAAAKPGDTPTSAFLRAGLLTLRDFLQHNPTYVRLTAWARLEQQIVETAAPLPAQNEILELVVDRIREAQAADLIQSDIDPATLMIILGGALYFFLEHQDQYASLIKQDKHSPTSANNIVDQYIDQLVRVMASGITLNK